MITPQVDRHVKFPDDKVALLEFVGLVFDTGTILEDELEVGLWTSLHKMDRYFYETIVYIVSVMKGDRLYTFQVDITVRERWSVHCSKEKTVESLANRES